jgi:hypothetical protein
VLIGVIAAVALTIILLPLIFTIGQPDLNQVQVRLTDVIISDADEQQMDMRVVFTIENPTDGTVTTSKIDYQLFANDMLVTPRTISYEDIPLNGRPAIFAGQSVTIPDNFVLEFEDDNAEVYNMILENPDAITWRATGTSQVESSLTFLERPVDNEV